MQQLSKNEKCHVADRISTSWKKEVPKWTKQTHEWHIQSNNVRTLTRTREQNSLRTVNWSKHMKHLSTCSSLGGPRTAVPSKKCSAYYPWQWDQNTDPTLLFMRSERAERKPLPSQAANLQRMSQSVKRHGIWTRMGPSCRPVTSSPCPWLSLFILCWALGCGLPTLCLVTCVISSTRAPSWERPNRNSSQICSLWRQIFRWPSSLIHITSLSKCF